MIVIGALQTSRALRGAEAAPVHREGLQTYQLILELGVLNDEESIADKEEVERALGNGLEGVCCTE